MVPSRRQRIGNWGETRAAVFLEEKGYQLIARNVRTPYGEIDLVMQGSDGLVFVEVKTRTNLKYGYPEQGVTGRKLEHMIAAAQSFIEDHPDLAGRGWQIDVVAILRDARKNEEDMEIRHFENVTG